MEFFWVLLAIIVLIVAFFIITYNSLIRKKNYVEEAWSRIDVNLKQKVNVLSNLVDIIKMQTSYEGETLKQLVEARNALKSGDRGTMIKANADINKNILPNIMALHENYPELKANQGFLTIMEQVRDTEAKVAYARNAYNMAVASFNSSLESFPTVLVAGMLKYKRADMFELDEAEREYSDDFRIGQM